MGGICGPWVGTADVKALAKYATLAESAVAPMLAPASEILWRMSGRRWPGTCSETGLRPCKRYATQPGMIDPAHWWDQSRRFWWGSACGCAWNACDCLVDALELEPYVPTVSVEKVTIDGVDLAAADYSLWDSWMLVRSDGGVWPTTQRLDLPAGDPGTWTIDLTYGVEPPADAKMAAAVLAAELALAVNPASGAGECELPARVQSVTRQGVTYLVSDPQQFFDEGRTGLYVVDLFLASANPERRRRGATLGYVGQPTGLRHES